MTGGPIRHDAVGHEPRHQGSGRGADGGSSWIPIVGLKNRQ